MKQLIEETFKPKYDFKPNINPEGYPETIQYYVNKTLDLLLDIDSKFLSIAGLTNKGFLLKIKGYLLSRKEFIESLVSNSIEEIAYNFMKMFSP